ncbi:MAG: cation:proton antiporter, partial [Gemmatimonadota bacterium]
MNELTSLGVILLFALLAGHLVKFARIPEVTGYLLAGVVVGPSGLRWISHDNLAALKVFSEVGLGLILFALGAAFDFARLRNTGRKLVIVTLVESTLCSVAVFGAMLALGQPVAVAILLGVIAVPTGAASTLMVLRECNSEGPLTATVTGVIGLNNVLALVAFSVAAAGIEMHGMVVSSGLTGEGLFRALFPLLWHTLGSCAVGFLVGLLLAGWASRVREAGETLILLTG